MEKKKRSLADALYLPGVADIEAEFPRVTIGLKPAQFEADEDNNDRTLAEQRLADIRSGKSDTVAIEELMKRYGLEVAGRTRAKNKAK
ncbi:TPA: hypothetical protein ACGJWA_002465 [Pseudomonas aeruginosa]|uniref:hypothetical protein n=1 Tax=Pseudomonas aeruginosa TaxID=287 RepID=UPI001872396D|nr:hypothetical protein [Pseudomonas aeruginosa]HBO1237258.1 hypothetical protein [Pseudomonas aeruginosa]HBO1875731.1 hypothetical protein [Pseudomonas aeruginosa]HBO2079883.1 hypothetical protein [Pseudomonas aeruginosa]HCH7472707.1 hypothetical protein [Pseudomonas aeruginosa]HCH7802492.1 hypothetical protein [Pseudomonas aeruginosa]